MIEFSTRSLAHFQFNFHSICSCANDIPFNAFNIRQIVKLFNSANDSRDLIEIMQNLHNVDVAIAICEWRKDGIEGVALNYALFSINFQKYFVEVWKL